MRNTVMYSFSFTTAALSRMSFADEIVSDIVAVAIRMVASMVVIDRRELESNLHKFGWLSLKVRSALEESQKYDIDNKPLQEMQQLYVAGVREVEEVLNELLDIVKPSIAPPGSTTDDRSFDIRTAKPDLYFKALHNISESLVKALRSISLRDLMVCTWRLFGRKCSDDKGNNFLTRLKKIEKLNHTLEKLEVMSNDVGDFLEMVRQQKRKRERRRRYRPYKAFFVPVYFELARDVLGYYCRAQVSWMGFLFPEMDAGAVTDRGIPIL